MTVADAGTNSFEDQRLVLTLTDARMLICINLNGELDRTWYDGGKFLFTEDVAQISGLCMLRNGEMLVTDCGRKLNGMNRIFHIRKNNEEFFIDQV